MDFNDFIYHANNLRLFYFCIHGSLARWTSFQMNFKAWGTEAGPVAWPSCWGPRTPTVILPRQQPLLTFRNFGACTVELLPRLEICIKGLRKIFPKINMKAKTSCQELQPHTSCWLGLLSLLTALIQNRAEACSDDLDLMSAPGSRSCVLKLFHGVAKCFQS